MQRVGKVDPAAQKPEETRPQPQSRSQSQQRWDAAGYDRKKRHRRTAGEIERHYKCPAPGCFKSYG